MITSGMDERDERKRTSDDASKQISTTSKPGSSPCSGISVEDTYLLTTRCPVFRRRDSHLGVPRQPAGERDPLDRESSGEELVENRTGTEAKAFEQSAVDAAGQNEG